METVSRCPKAWHDPHKQESHRCKLPAGHEGDHVCKDEARLPQD